MDLIIDTYIKFVVKCFLIRLSQIQRKVQSEKFFIIIVKEIKHNDLFEEKRLKKLEDYKHCD